MPTRESSLDVVIRFSPLEDSGQLVQSLFRLPLGLYASPRYLATHTPLSTPDDLRDHDCITTNCIGHSETAAVIWRFEHGSEIKEIRVRPRISVPDPSMNDLLASSGAGIALMTQKAAEREVEQGRLIRLLPDWESRPLEFHAVYSTRPHASPKVRAFLQALRESLRTSPIPKQQVEPALHRLHLSASAAQ